MLRLRPRQYGPWSGTPTPILRSAALRKWCCSPPWSFPPWTWAAWAIMRPLFVP